jgi:hypothetical protein
MRPPSRLWAGEGVVDVADLAHHPLADVFRHPCPVFRHHQFRELHLLDDLVRRAVAEHGGEARVDVAEPSVLDDVNARQGLLHQGAETALALAQGFQRILGPGMGRLGVLQETQGGPTGLLLQRRTGFLRRLGPLVFGDVE